MNCILTIGLTGAMGAGKSAALRAFEELGAETADADKLAHEVLENDEAAKAEIRKLLGDEVFDAAGRPIRAEIAKKVFAERELLKSLEGILHPAVRKLWKAPLKRPNAFAKVVEIPLLFEKNLEKDFDFCVSVFCSEALRKKRLTARGLSPQEIEMRDALQLSALKKADMANVVLFNESDEAFLKKQAAIILFK